MLESQIVYLEVDSIIPNEYNPNEMPQDIFDSLLEDARENGPEALSPIEVRPLERQRYEIIDGESRWKAAKQLGWQRIRATIRKVSLDEAKVINYRKNRERGTLNPFKEAMLFKIELDQGKTYDEIAVKYGVSHAQVGARLSLSDITEETKQIVTRVTMDKKVSPSHLEVLASIKEPEKQKELAERVVALDLSVRETEVEAKKLVETSKEKEEKLKEQKLCDLEQILEELRMVIGPHKSEMLVCEECELYVPCQEVKERIKNLGTILLTKSRLIEEYA